MKDSVVSAFWTTILQGDPKVVATEIVPEELMEEIREGNLNSLVGATSPFLKE